MQPKHSAIVAGLTLALSFGAVSAPAPAAAEEPTPGVASDATDIDKGLYTQQSFSGVLRSVQGVSFVNVTPEMKYFTKYESHGNYNQGFSYGDGYNALGYYQFDRQVLARFGRRDRKVRRRRDVGRPCRRPRD